jgi:hypothetical protein
MLVWLELPLWLPQMDAEQIAQIQREYAAIVRQVRNHPSIVLWDAGLRAFGALSRRRAGRAVRAGESDSQVARWCATTAAAASATAGALREHADFADYHLYGDAHFARATFRAFLDAPRAPAPWLQGEFADHDTMRDFQTLRQSVPAEQLWWLMRDPAVNPQGVRWFYETPFVEERLQQAGLWESLPETGTRLSLRDGRLPQNSCWRRCAACLALQGYVLTGLKDTPISTAGILDERGEPKVALEEYLAFNADTVLLLDWHRRRDWVAGGDRPANPRPIQSLRRADGLSAPLRVALRRAYRERDFALAIGIRRRRALLPVGRGGSGADLCRRLVPDAGRTAPAQHGDPNQPAVSP